MRKKEVDVWTKYCTYFIEAFDLVKRLVKLRGKEEFKIFKATQ